MATQASFWCLDLDGRKRCIGDRQQQLLRQEGQPCQLPAGERTRSTIGRPWHACLTPPTNAVKPFSQ